MDTGLPSTIRKETIVAEQALVDSTLKRLGILQGLLVNAVGYLSGQHIGQTIYTCTLLHEDVLCSSLQSPIVALLKTLGLSRHLLLASHSAADEDFVFDLMEFSLFDDVSESLLQAELESYLLSLQSTEGTNEDTCLKDIVGLILAWFGLLRDLVVEESECDWAHIQQRLGHMRDLLCSLVSAQNFFLTDGLGMSLSRTFFDSHILTATLTQNSLL
jgi:hypothetical protein